jgi:hypothetical protein
MKKCITSYYGRKKKAKNHQAVHYALHETSNSNWRVRSEHVPNYISEDHSGVYDYQIVFRLKFCSKVADVKVHIE